MRGIEAYADLRAFGRPVISTDDVSVRLKTSISAATRILDRLSHAGLVIKLRRGLWCLDKNVDPLTLPEYLTAPFSSYVSLQSALYFHGMISQIPQVIYVASLGPTRNIKTTVGVFSIHHLAPEVFGGFNSVDNSGIKIATPEKALLDILYLSCTKSRLFATLPELELPAKFRIREAHKWAALIPAAYRRKMVERRLACLLASSSVNGNVIS